MGNADNFCTVKELSKLRRATTERERKAIFWFFGPTCNACVLSGRRACGEQRYQETVSKATETGGHAKVVTMSDKACALLLFDNNIEEWLSEKQPPLETNEPPTDLPDDKMKEGPRRKGKYTDKKSVHCKYGGWSRGGTARFNHFYYSSKQIEPGLWRRQWKSKSFNTARLSSMQMREVMMRCDTMKEVPMQVWEFCTRWFVLRYTGIWRIDENL